MRRNNESEDCLVSLFSSAGFGDFGICKGLRIPLLCACELLPDRCEQLRLNFPEAKIFEGDIATQKHALIDFVKKKLNGKRPRYLLMSPPCQGMSSNGVGRIHASMHNGTRSTRDERNELIVQSIEIANALCPDWIIVENVAGMARTEIPIGDTPQLILDYIHDQLPLYSLRTKVMDFADYGVPQRRIRLITIGCRIPHVIRLHPKLASLSVTTTSPFHPAPHAKKISLNEAISHLPVLDALSKTRDDQDALHNIPKWNAMQYECMKATKEGCTAFDNPCNSCGKAHPRGVLWCDDCKTVLPRPFCTFQGWICKECHHQNRTHVKKCKCGTQHTDEERVPCMRICSGFATSYRRQNRDRSANTLTQNSGVISSDCKGHPVQHRVLSVREVLILSSIDALPDCDNNWQGTYKWGDRCTDSRFIRQVAGESIPSVGAMNIVKHLITVSARDAESR